MASATDCHDCGAPDAILIAVDLDGDEGYHDTLYLCRACADEREGIPPMDEQTMAGDGEGRR